MWRPSSRSEQVAVAALAVLVATGLVAGLVVATTPPPSVGEVSQEWGAVTEESAAVEATAVVDNRYPFPVPGVVDVGVRVQMNDVTVAPATRRTVGFPSGESTLSLTTYIQSERIADWFPTHVENGERTAIRIEPVVSAPLFAPDPPARERTLETDLLAAFRTTDAQTVTASGAPVATVAPADAAWGTPTNETTPVTITTVIENERDVPITVENVTYAVTMNDVAVGDGGADPVTVPAGETREVAYLVEIENDRLADWWPTHVANGERTVVNVSTTATVTVRGESEDVTIDALSQRTRFETDLLDTGTASMEPVEDDR